MRNATFENLNPCLTHATVHFEAVDCVRVDGGVEAKRNAGQQRCRYGFDHRYELLANERPALYTPKIQLMRLADV
jgi:hypothetical protein